MSSSKTIFPSEGDALTFTPQPKDEQSSLLRTKPFETPDNNIQQNEKDEKQNSLNPPNVNSADELTPTNPNVEPGYQVPIGTKTINPPDPSKTEETQPALLPYEVTNCPSAATLDIRRLSDKYVRPDEINRQHLVVTNVVNNRCENFHENRGLYGGAGKRS